MRKFATLKKSVLSSDLKDRIVDLQIQVRFPKVECVEDDDSLTNIFELIDLQGEEIDLTIKPEQPPLPFGKTSKK